MKKISRILMGVVFTAVLLLSLILTAPAAAGAQDFSKAAEPSDSGAICAYGTVIYDFAVAPTNTNIIYAAVSGNETLKSLDQGRTWSEIHIGPAGTDKAAEFVAVAGDDANVVVYASNVDYHVRISLNGGTSFYDLGIPTNAAADNDVVDIFSIDISKPFTDLYGNTYRYVGVAADGGSGAAFYYIQVGAYTPFDWQEAVEDFLAGGGGTYLGSDSYFFAVKFSPAFGIDNVAYLLAQGPDGVVELHVASFNLPGNWDATISGFIMYDGWGTDTGVGTTICTLASGDAEKGQIAFDPGYSGVYYSPYARTAYCSVANGYDDEGGAFRIREDASARPHVSALVEGSIWSIGLNADGTILVMADELDTTVYKATAADAWDPDYVTYTLPIKTIASGSLVPFGGLGDTYSRTIISYAGSNVVAAKQGQAGAFSLSTDNSYTFNDISLVNTFTTAILDKAVSADGKYRYVVSQGNSFGGEFSTATFTSVWYWDGTYWERVLVRADMDSYAIRASPVSFGTVYLADTYDSAGIIYYTSTYGKVDWRFREAPRPATTIKDLEVVDDANLYVAVDIPSGGFVCPLTYSGLYWNSSDYIQVFGGAYVDSITLVNAQSVLACSAENDIAYTTTGGNTPTEWIQIPVKVGMAAGGFTVATAASLGPYSIIYAIEQTASDPYVWYYVLSIDLYTWIPCYKTQLNSSPAPVFRDIFFYNGCLYAASEGNFTTTDASDVDHTYTGVELARAFLADATLYDSTLVFPYYGWGADYYTDTIYTLFAGVWDETPNILKGSADATGLPGNQIWFIDVNMFPKYLSEMRSWGEWIAPTMKNVVYTDELAVTKPSLVSPVDKYIVQVNKETGIAYDVALTWKTAAGATQYTVEVAADAAFTDIRLKDTDADTPFVIGPHGWAALDGTTLWYEPGEIYYWKVRATSPFFSAWSEVRELDIQSAPIPVPDLYSPLNDAVVATLTPSFSWSPMSGTMTGDTDPTSGITTTYTLQIGTNPSFPVLTFHEYHATNTTGFIMPDGVLANGTTYYWRVCPQITPLTNWSATFHFNVDLSAGKTTVTATSYSAPATVAVPTNATNTTIEQTSPAYIWAIIIIGAILVIAIIVLILRVKK